MAAKSTINSRHEKTSKSNKGGSALTSDHQVARDTKGIGKGTINSRSVSTKPSASSGSVGSAQPFREARAKSETQASTYPKGYNKLGRTYKSTKPSKGRR